MTTHQQIVEPECIESELRKIWEELAKEKKMRASLFNLIVVTQRSERTDYIRNIVQKVVKKFPCRTLFISEDPAAKKPYLKTAVSVLIPENGESSTACDLIDIGVAPSDIEKVHFLLLQHLIPDLPVYVLWSGDPSKPHPLFKPLCNLATRMIFDSEEADSLLAFAKTILKIRQETDVEVADLNWARTGGWRGLIASVFGAFEGKAMLREIESIKFVYNSRKSDFFCHLKIQSMYLLAWMMSRLDWELKEANKNLSFKFRSEIQAKIESELFEKLGSGTVIATEISTKSGHHFQATRIRERYHYVEICHSSSASCELPYEFMLGQTATGASLVNEICKKGTSAHYLQMLEQLIILDADKLC